MKNKKLIILYILMLLIGLALLFTGPSDENKVEKNQEPPERVEVIPEPVKPVTEMVNIAVAKTDLSSHTIVTPKDYYFKTIEVSIDNFDKSQYILDPEEINNYVVKNNIQRESLIQKSLLASPYSEEYRALALKNGEFIFPIEIAKEDSYLLRNLQIGDLIDIYIVFGYERNSNQNNDDGVVSPGRNFSTTNIKPIVAGKKIFFIEDETTKLTSTTINRDTLGRIDLVLTNEEIKLVRTLMTNSTIILYPSAFSKNLDKGMFILTEREKNWPESQKEIFNYRPIARLRGN